ncbi:hypothetical protein C0993_008923 [Termitomyces sp. T159_Od127]|nr:hypothetical protein C0993_008923 [Termitomyces sp. T159_Od127]
MPGPSNSQKRRKFKGKGTKKGHQAVTEKSLPSLSDADLDKNTLGAPARSPCHISTLHTCVGTAYEPGTIAENGRLVAGSRREHQPSRQGELEMTVPQAPFIHDPGNGPRVRDVRTFLSSKFFAQPPALNDPLCAEFAQKEVLEMLMTVLPEEVALGSRRSFGTTKAVPQVEYARLVTDSIASAIHWQITYLANLLLSAWTPRRPNYPNAIKSAWGRTAVEMDDCTWDILNTKPQDSAGDPDLTMLMRMTRLDDLGLGQLCLGLDPEDILRAE